MNRYLPRHWAEVAAIAAILGALGIGWLMILHIVPAWAVLPYLALVLGGIWLRHVQTRAAAEKALERQARAAVRRRGG